MHRHVWLYRPIGADMEIIVYGNRISMLKWHGLLYNCHKLSSRLCVRAGTWNICRNTYTKEFIWGIIKYFICIHVFILRPEKMDTILKMDFKEYFFDGNVWIPMRHIAEGLIDDVVKVMAWYHKSKPTNLILTNYGHYKIPDALCCHNATFVSLHHHLDISMKHLVI